MKQAARFTFKKYHIDREQNQIVFYYQIEFADQSSETFVETLTFPRVPNPDWDRIPAELLDRMLQTLFLFIGISYWKMYCPRLIRIESFALTEEQAEFWNTVYIKGLGEFFYKNKIDFRGLVRFPFDAQLDASKPVPFPRRDRCLLPFGGGKDSIVSAERLKMEGKAFDLYWMGDSPLIERLAAIVGVESLIVRRELDPEMIRQSMNREVPYNGHVPVSTLYASVGVLVCLLFDYRSVVLSNERSANFGNVEYLGQEINHQWSKSAEFERMLQDYLQRFITPDVTVFSLLRPYDELEIVRQFVQFPQYFGLFSSCNRNFTIAKSIPPREGRAYWCGACPKCAFVFALLAAFLPKDQVVGIVGKNLYADASLIPLYRELLGLEAIKPFECVGTPEEVRLAMRKAHERREYQDDPVMKLFEYENF